MNDIISTIITAATKVAVVGTLTGSMLYSYSGAVKWACPILREAVDYQESVVATAEAMESSAAGPAREEWEPKKAIALQRIAALEGTARTLDMEAAKLLQEEAQAPQ